MCSVVFAENKVAEKQPKRLVKALYDYENVYAGEVRFQKGDEMEVLDRLNYLSNKSVQKLFYRCTITNGGSL